MKLVVPEGITLCKLVNFQGLAILEGRLLKYWVLYIIVALEPQEGRDIYRGTCTGFYPFPFFPFDVTYFTFVKAPCFTGSRRDSYFDFVPIDHPMYYCPFCIQGGSYHFLAEGCGKFCEY